MRAGEEEESEGQGEKGGQERTKAPETRKLQKVQTGGDRFIGRIQLVQRLLRHHKFRPVERLLLRHQQFIRQGPEEQVTGWRGPRWDPGEDTQRILSLGGSTAASTFAPTKAAGRTAPTRPPVHANSVATATGRSRVPSSDAAAAAQRTPKSRGGGVPWQAMGNAMHAVRTRCEVLDVLGKPWGMPCTQCAHSAKFWMSANTRTLVSAPFHKFLVLYQGFFLAS